MIWERPEIYNGVRKNEMSKVKGSIFLYGGLMMVKSITHVVLLALCLFLPLQALASCREMAKA
jgi:hypothetical protein